MCIYIYITYVYIYMYLLHSYVYITYIAILLSDAVLVFLASSQGTPGTTAASKQPSHECPDRTMETTTIITTGKTTKQPSMVKTRRFLSDHVRIEQQQQQQQQQLKDRITPQVNFFQESEHKLAAARGRQDRQGRWWMIDEVKGCM